MERKSHFSDAYRYLETENGSQLENYATEMLVLILCYLKSGEERFSDINKQIAELLEFSKADYKNARFETQKSHTDFSCEINNKVLIPDISIYVNDKLHTLIEVKIDQGLNQYTKEDGKTINQLEAYESIKNVQKVILLSKNKEEYETENDKIKFIRWYEIYEKLETIQGDFIISHYLQFLDEKDIGKQKPLQQLGIDILDYLGNFSSLLHNAWEKSNINEFYLSNNTYAYKWGLGFYVKRNGTKDGSGETDFFLGINHFKDYRESIGFWCKNANNLDKLEKVDGGYMLKNSIKLEDIYKVSSDKKNEGFDEQINTLSDWINKNIKPILENNQQEGEN